MYPRAYSADVQLELVIGDRKLALAQIGPFDVIVKEPCYVPPCDAVIVIRVDGRQHRRTVTLPEGISPTSDLVKTTNRKIIQSDRPMDWLYLEGH